MAGLRRQAWPVRRRGSTAERPRRPGARGSEALRPRPRRSQGPAAKAAAPAAKAAAQGRRPGSRATPRPCQLSGKTYTVQSGDTLSKIAEKLSIAGGWQHLADANTATISNPHLVFPGQVLQLPA